MGQPIEIKNKNDIIQELMAVTSSLNMSVLEEETISITADTYLANLYFTGNSTNEDTEENERQRLVHLHYLGVLNDLEEAITIRNMEKCLEIIQIETAYAEKEIDLLTDL